MYHEVECVFCARIYIISADEFNFLTKLIFGFLFCVLRSLLFGPFSVTFCILT